MILDRLEARFGRCAIPGIIRYVVLFNALVYLLAIAAPGFLQILTLDAAKVFEGEVWRVFSWIFIPRTTEPLFLLIALWFLWFLGDIVEGSWGSFRVNAFYLCGWFLTTVAGLALPGSGVEVVANLFLNLSILLAAATLQPNFQILLFFIIPIKLKWLAWLSLLLPALFFLGSGLGGKIAISLCFANYLLFFGPQFMRNQKVNAQNAGRRARFEASKIADETMHCCTVCSRTEVSDPDLEFRVSADGQEYCMDHLPKKN